MAALRTHSLSTQHSVLPIRIQVSNLAAPRTVERGVLDLEMLMQSTLRRLTDGL